MLFCNMVTDFGNSSRNSATVNGTEINTWCLMTFVLCIVGVVGNLGVLILTLRSPSLRRGSGVLICNVLIIYVFNCLIAFPSSVITVYLTSVGHQLPSSLCEVHILYVGGTLVGEWAEFFLSVNRFVAVCWPHRYAPLTRTWVMCWFIGASWMLGFGSALPYSFHVQVRTETEVGRILFGPACQF